MRRHKYYAMFETLAHMFVEALLVMLAETGQRLQIIMKTYSKRQEFKSYRSKYQNPTNPCVQKATTQT